MPSDKHNSRTARARDLISLINVASSRDVPFHQPQLLQCLHQGATFVLDLLFNLAIVGRAVLPYWSTNTQQSTKQNTSSHTNTQTIQHRKLTTITKKTNYYLYPFDLPYFSSQPRKVMMCGRHVMASVRDKIAEALLVLCLAYYVMKRVRHC